MVSICYHDYRHDPFGYIHLANENTKRRKCQGCFMPVRAHLLESEVSYYVVCHYATDTSSWVALFTDFSPKLE